MAAAFQNTAFQNTAFQTAATVTPPVPVGGYLGNFKINEFGKPPKPPKEDLTRRIRQREEISADIRKSLTDLEGFTEQPTLEPAQVEAAKKEVKVAFDTAEQFRQISLEAIAALRTEYAADYLAQQQQQELLARQLEEQARQVQAMIQAAIEAEQDDEESIAMLLL